MGGFYVQTGKIKELEKNPVLLETSKLVSTIQ